MQADSQPKSVNKPAPREVLRSQAIARISAATDEEDIAEAREFAFQTCKDSELWNRIRVQLAINVRPRSVFKER